jgi:sulfate adenylyltransferase (ADP) / ATP adenylyltransferase
MAFMAILDEMYHTMRVRGEHERKKQNNEPSISPENTSKPSSSPSYNVVMTLEHIYLVPRSAEKFIQSVEGGEENEVYLDLSVNSLGYAGMLLVKSEEELEKVKGVGIGRILSRVGMEPLKEEDDKGCDDVFADLA